MAFIIDNYRKICKGEKTGVWIKDKFYSSNDRENGAILIPYSTSQETTKIIMIHNHFAQLSEFTRKTEVYSFDAHFHLNVEQVLVGQEASILIRPTLLVNGRKTNVKLLKSIKVKLEC